MFTFQGGYRVRVCSVEWREVFDVAEGFSCGGSCLPSFPGLRTVGGDKRANCTAAEGGEDEGDPACGCGAHVVTVAPRGRLNPGFLAYIPVLNDQRLIP